MLDRYALSSEDRQAILELKETGEANGMIIRKLKSEALDRALGQSRNPSRN